MQHSINVTRVFEKYWTMSLKIEFHLLLLHAQYY